LTKLFAVILSRAGIGLKPEHYDHPPKRAGYRLLSASSRFMQKAAWATENRPGATLKPCGHAIPFRSMAPGRPLDRASFSPATLVVSGLLVVVSGQLAYGSSGKLDPAKPSR